MRGNEIVRFENASISLTKTKRRKGAGRGQRLRRFAGETQRTVIPVIQDVSFGVQPGESIALVGGRPLVRTAILRLAAGTLIPDTGTVTTRVPVVPMIGIARSFGRTFTIRQNIFLASGLLGVKPSETANKLDDIVEFTGVASFLDRHLGAAPASTRQKLAWSIAMSIPASTYLVDQTLVVGEREFRQKCWTKVDQLREDGATFIISSDSTKQYRRFCDRALYFVEGSLVADGAVREILALARKARQQSREDEQ